MHLGCKKRLKRCATLWVGLFCIKMMWHFFPFPKRFCFKCFGRRRILKSPLHSFLLCQINPSAFPICLSLKAVQWGCSQTRVIKKKNINKAMVPQGLPGGHPNLDPHTNPLGGLPPLSLFLLSTSFLREADLVGLGGAITHIHSCMHPDSMTHF